MNKPELPPVASIPTGRYRHYKGNEYEIIDVARHSETLEELVVYRALYGECGLWVRPRAMFMETVEVDGKLVPRFQYVGQMRDSREEVKIVADYFDGKPVYEAVPAVKLADNRYRITASPGMAPGIASGDEIELSPAEKTGYRVLERGGNVCVQLFLTKCDQQDRLAIAELAKSIGGWLDGGDDAKDAHLLIFTIPITVGFRAIESMMKKISESYAVAKWMYGNVYDTRDGVTPLNWW